MTQLRFGLAGLGVFWFLLGTARAMAAPANEDPEALIQEGVKLRRQGDDARAEGYIRRAYQIAATPRTAAQLGLVELALKEYLEAEGHLAEAMRTPDAWINAHRKTIEDSLTMAHAHLVRVKITGAPKGTTVSVDGADAQPLRSDAAVWIKPGVATLALQATGYKSATLSATGAAGDTRDVTVDMPALAAPPPVASAPSPEPVAPAPAAPEPEGGAGAPATQPSPPHDEGTPGKALRVTGICIGAVGVVAGVVGGILIAEGNSKVGQIETQQTYQPANGNYETLQNAGAGLVIGGVVALAGGAALYLVGRHQATTSAGTAADSSVSFTASPQGGVLAWRGRF
jgi:hypothetical protein